MIQASQNICGARGRVWTVTQAIHHEWYHLDFLLLSTFLSILILFSSLCSRGPGSCTAPVTVITCNISADVGWTLRTVHLGCNSGNANRVLIWLRAYEKALQERPSSLRLMSSSTFNPRFDTSDIFQTLFVFICSSFSISTSNFPHWRWAMR